MSKQEIVEDFVERISHYLTEDELETVLQAIKIVDKKGIKTFTSVCLDALCEVELNDD